MVRKVLVTAACTALVACVNAQIVRNLEQGGKVFWKFNSGRYEITGAVSLSGGLGSSDPIEFLLQDLNNDGRRLDIRLCMEDLFPDLGIQYCLDLIGTVISETSNEAIVRWAASGNPNQCIPISISGTTVQVLITEITGALQARITPIPCRPNPYNSSWRNVTLFADENGGNENNFLRISGYLFCLQSPSTFAQAYLFNLDWEAYGGGLTGVFGNLNGDNIVNNADLLQVLFNFGSSNPDGDANGDGIVNNADLLLVLFNFGRSC